MAFDKSGLRHFLFSIDGFGIETFAEAFLHFRNSRLVGGVFREGLQFFGVGLKIEQFRPVADVVVILVLPLRSM